MKAKDGIAVASSSRRSQTQMGEGVPGKGKIARLPHLVREALHQKLRDGEQGPVLLKWLNSLPETQKMLQEKFEGQPISKQNLSEWVQRGYQAWLAKQEAFEQMCLAMEAPAKFGPDSANSLTERLAQWLSVRCLVEAHRQEEAGVDLDLGAFGRLCRSLSALRRGDHSVRRLELEAARMDLRLGADSKKLNELFWEWTKRPEIKEKLWPKQLTPEEQFRAYKEILGVSQGYEWPAEKELRLERERREAEARSRKTEGQTAATEAPGGAQEPADTPEAPEDGGRKGKETSGMTEEELGRYYEKRGL